VLSALKTIADNMKIYSVGSAWLTDRSGTLRRTIAVDASGARVLPDSSHAAEFKYTKSLFLKKLQATSPSSTSSPSPRISATAAGGKKPSDKEFKTESNSTLEMSSIWAPGSSNHNHAR
jgi:hypothetical protein